MSMKVRGDTHWFLQHNSGLIVDPTAAQFKHQPNYSRARGRGFLTAQPSKRAQVLMQKLLWQK